MGKISEGVAIALGAQVAEGTVNGAVATATSIVSTSPGAGEALGILFDPDTLSWDFDRNEESIMCSSTLGPASEPSLVTWPTRKRTVPDCFAKRVR